MNGVDVETDFSCSCFCEEDNVIYLKLKTDGWPEETSFSLTNIQTGEIVWSVSNLEPQQTTVYTAEDIDPTDCFHFLIEDSAGDGILGGGGYFLYYQGELVSSGGDFGSSAEVFVGNGCVN